MELESRQHIMELDPDMESYEAIEDAGSLLALFAYDEGEIVGYSISFLLPHMHSRGVLVCQNDALYVDPDRRNESFGRRLIQETERIAHERGAKLVTWNARTGTRFEEFMPSIGYSVREIVFSKEL
jgi:GNAT superfamily N-acetyltransferase